MANPFGHCKICGSMGPLSFEHVPPRSAFNDQRAFLSNAEEIFERKDSDALGFDNLRGKSQPKGLGTHSLCESCNNKTGAWYGRAYVEWAYQGARMGVNASKSPFLAYPFEIYPLRVLKQIICMFFATNDGGFRQHRPDLVRFVLNKREVGMDPKIRILAYHNISGRARQTGRAVMLRDGSPFMLSEVTFFPWGYVMNEDDLSPDRRLLDISGFARFHFEDKVTVGLKIPVLPIYTPFPADYRTREETLAEAMGVRE